MFVSRSSLRRGCFADGGFEAVTNEWCPESTLWEGPGHYDDEAKVCVEFKPFG